MIDNRRKIRSRAENWSVDVFLRVLNDFRRQKIFSIFLKKFAPILDFLIEISEKIDFFRNFFWKIREQKSVTKII